MAQPRDPAPVRPLRSHAAAYHRALSSAILQPMYRDIRKGATDAYAAAALLAQLDANRWVTPDLGNLAQSEARKAMDRLQGYHTRRLIDTFRKALGVDITGLLAEAPIAVYMQQRIVENVDLIVTIPPRFHDGLKRRLQQQLRTQPFDQALVAGMLAKQYQASGYQLRRLARDQTTKTIGGLTRVRDEQMGITHYRWMTSRDGRVRPAHAKKEGQTFAWATPPADTGHPGEDVQCRCVAVPVIPRVKHGEPPARVGQAAEPSTAAPQAGKRNLKFLPGKGAYAPDDRRGSVVKTRNLGDEVQMRFDDGSTRWYRAAELRSITEFKQGVKPPKPPGPKKRLLKFLPGKKAVTPDGRTGVSVATKQLGHRVEVEFPDGSREWWDASELRSVTEAKKLPPRPRPKPKPDPEPEPDPVNPWKPGDHVEMFAGARGTVVKIRGDQVQVRQDETGFLLWYHMDQLKRAPAPDKVKPKRNTKFLVGKTVYRPNGARGKVTKTRNLGNEIFVQWDDGQSGWSQASSLRLKSELKTAPKPVPKAAFKFGDRVVSNATNRIGTITHVDPDGQVWVRYDDDGSIVGPVLASRFRRLTKATKPTKPTKAPPRRPAGQPDPYDTVEGITAQDASEARRQAAALTGGRVANIQELEDRLRGARRFARNTNVSESLRDDFRKAAEQLEAQVRRAKRSVQDREAWEKKYLTRVGKPPQVPYEIADMGLINPDSGSLTAGYPNYGGLSSVQRKQAENKIEQAVEWFSRVTHRDWAATDKIRFYVSTHPSSGRAFARERGRGFTEVWISPDASVKTIVHEMGHALENLGKAKGRKRAVDYVHSRTAHESLQDIYGDGREKSRFDQFRDKYIGKEYMVRSPGQTQYSVAPNPWTPGGKPIYGTELLSMGAQYMFDDPVAFARNDPGHFEWTLRELRRLQKGAKPVTRPSRRPTRTRPAPLPPAPKPSDIRRLVRELDEFIIKGTAGQSPSKHRARLDFVDQNDRRNQLLLDYIGAAGKYRDVNEALRKGRKGSKSTRDIIDFITSKATPSKAPETVYRGMAFHSVEDAMKAIGKIGDSRSVPDFMSTSTYLQRQFLANTTHSGSKKVGVVLKINKGKGVQQVVTNPVEQEIIMMPGTQMRVNAIHHVEGKRHYQIVVEVDAFPA